MRVVVYGRESLGALGFLSRGLEAAGCRLEFREDRGAYRRGLEDVERFDLAMTDGVRGPMGEMLEDALETGVPVIVTDLGFVRRDLAYFQVGIDRLNWLPPFECPGDRWEALEVEPQERKSGRDILIAGQKPGDGSHGLEAPELVSIYQRWIEEIREFTRRRIVFRPHPKAFGMAINGVYNDMPTDSRNGGLAGAIGRAHAVVTINSTAGTDALLAGKPVYCEPSAQYAALANHGFESISDPYFPDRETRIDHFHRVAYAQWTPFELQTRKVAEWIIDAAFQGREGVRQTGAA